ncbi:MAG: hypothetical protein COX77_01405 [Candidatus Komeilibacteria bacterium CG_4_10_14_0_2_um_filter_37_10]|uniref:RNA polymerase sigma factor n=1 Tax=Candidatus Komeilibacteria bacterium CG_4_10_14_0_2_um_filter_37_10 TaxID=1974470 RepID=A0A2M7VFT2_9BACT|nr:MAG: hypothetical protein COX77_01405 [Candidatus Komeilibacteria bacterium CG_4_10_14_0_2_um_filter_37_10]PJA93873.1 MAG: hypothetical protein CO133_00915 [Candidatus Komeilibacteria bacterium CG_4_9_14_3_um_filter_37_5]
MSKENLKDRILVLRARLGNKAAFGELYNKYVNKLYRFVYFKVNDTELTQDIIAQTFLKFWELIVKEKRISEIQALLYQIAKNLVIDSYREKSNQPLPLLYDTEGEVDPALIVEFDLHAKIDSQLVHRALEQINNADYKEVIVLRYIEGLSITEIAKITDKSTGNIRILNHRALAELKKILHDYL